MEEQINIMVATPCGRGQLEAGYVFSCLNLQEHFFKKGWKIGFSFSSGALVHRLRNELTDRFLKGKFYTHILFIDSDIQFETRLIDKMLKFDKGVVAGICPYKKYNEVGQLEGNLCLGDHKGHPLNRDGLLEVQSIGTGIMLIKREVFEEVKDYTEKVKYYSSHQAQSGEKTHEETCVWNFFEHYVDENSVEFGEDISFCKKLAEAGIPIFALPSFDVVHWGLHGYGSEKVSPRKFIDFVDKIYDIP